MYLGNGGRRNLWSQNLKLWLSQISQANQGSLRAQPWLHNTASWEVYKCWCLDCLLKDTNLVHLLASWSFQNIFKSTEETEIITVCRWHHKAFKSGFEMWCRGLISLLQGPQKCPWKGLLSISLQGWVGGWASGKTSEIPSIFIPFLKVK